MIDVLDEAGRPTGRTAAKSEAHRLGLWHRCFHCWVFGADSFGEPYVLFQRRAAAKDTWPGCLDVAAAGHLQAGEKPLDGRRELEEELGLDVSPERLLYLGERRVERRIPQGEDREIHAAFILFDSTPPARLRLQKEEVESLIRVNLPAAEALPGGESVPATEYTQGHELGLTVDLSDFVPESAGYLRAVLEAARRALAGKKVGRVF